MSAEPKLGYDRGESQQGDGDRLNCNLANLEWVPAEADRREDSARARAIDTWRRAEESRKALEGRHHSDSGELQAEDRLR